ncbi:NADH-quinone oxidoreductase subunit K, partial [Listeria monocytogenes]|uniref:NADH-quinone oxidoreductase subunit K n=1 Tax=Listeria monocytogenes TaxID=1639 RepID=UPI000E6CBF2F
FPAAVDLILSKRLVRIIIGSSVLSHSVLLLVFTTGGLNKGGVPIVVTLGGGTNTGPLPHAHIWTAIVISFGVTALILVLAYRV